MGFLDNTNTIDAILTKKGRELLAQGKFNPTKFAVADDEVDYGLLSLEDGEQMILNMKVLEASSLGGESNTQLKYKLITTVNTGGIVMPVLSINPQETKFSVYGYLEVAISSSIAGADKSFTIQNPNSNAVTLNPYVAMGDLSRNEYHKPVSSPAGIITTRIAPKYKGSFANSSTQTLPETFVTSPDADGVHKFFIFARKENATPITIAIQGNDTGVYSTFTVSLIQL